MGVSILSIGEPGTGKSRAIKNLDPKTTFLIKPNNKQLPFRGAATLYGESKGNAKTCTTFKEVGTMIDLVNTQAKHIKTIVIEDLTHYFSARVMKDANIKGFDKWMDLAKDVFDQLVAKEAILREDLNLIIIAHTTIGVDVEGNPQITLHTPGKLLENNIKIPSYFTYVLHTVVTMEDDKPTYQFLTNRDGNRLAKSPEECLPLMIDNDYKMVLDLIETYQRGE
jgi:hypothetical protein